MSESIPGILPLSKVVSIYEQNKEHLTKTLTTPTLESLPTAFFVTLNTLYNVYHSSQPKWLKIRDSVLVSFIKETKKPREMNSSVTSGIVAQIKNPATSIIAVLNCGTGALKYQFYKIEDGVAVVVYEHKPKTAPSLSEVNIPGLFAGKVEPGETQAAIARDLEECKKKFNPAFLSFSAVITGDIRAAYYKLPATPEGEKNRQVFESTIKKIFEPLQIPPWNGKNYFITQDEEGSCEIAAVKNLHKGIDQRLQVLISFGIGRGSCQWSHEKLVVGNSDGMNRPEQMLSMASVVGDKFKTADYVNLFVDSILPNALPVIALKSGTLIHFYNDANLQKLFGI